MAQRSTRRQVLKAGLFAGITVLTAPGLAHSYARNEKLRMACIGAGGQAGGGINAALGQQLVAVAEVDPGGRGRKGIEEVRKRAPSAKVYTDFRRLFDAHRELDAVWVATPDHTHFPATVRAMHAGAGVYCEKPLTYSIAEARKLRELAAEKKVATQMGNQGHSSEAIRILCEYVGSGTVGEVTEVHCVSNRAFSAGRAPATQPAPAGLDWEAWLGPAPWRNFHGGLHPFSWRGWLDFGTGSIGDMGCHTMDGAVWALKLFEAPSVEVEPEFGKCTAQGYPAAAVIVYRFPARGTMPAVTLKWYQGGKLPPRPPMLEQNRQPLTQGAYYYGSKAVLSTTSHCQGVRIIPEEQQKQMPPPAKTLPRVSGGHGGDFLRACRGGGPSSAEFGYSSRLTEIVLLGNIACRVGEKITYDMKTGRVSNNAKADGLVARAARQGWE